MEHAYTPSQAPRPNPSRNIKPVETEPFLNKATQNQVGHDTLASARLSPSEINSQYKQKMFPRKIIRNV